jgi:hypothetical protein
MTRVDWQKEGRTWLHPECQFFIVEREIPEILAGGRKGAVEYHVVRGGGDDSAGFSAAILLTVEDAIAEAERQDGQERRTR